MLVLNYSSIRDWCSISEGSLQYKGFLNKSRKRPLLFFPTISPVRSGNSVVTMVREDGFGHIQESVP